MDMLREFEYLIVFSALVACQNADRKVDIVRQEVNPPLANSTAPAPSPPKLAEPLGGPSVIVDSTIVEAQLQRTGKELIVRLPPRMARLLYDTLPGFTVLRQSAYGPPSSHTPDSAWSVVVGDFDGDSRRDVALLGASKNTPALFFLLANSDSANQPHIVFIEPATPPDRRSYTMHFVGPGKFPSPDNDEYVLDLHTDAIQLTSELVSTICYLEHGALRWFSLFGD